MNNPYCQNAAQSDKLSPLQDYVYPFHDKDVATPLSFFAFIAYLCLAVMHLLQFTDAEHFDGLYMDSVLHSFQPIAFILSLLWIVATLLALVPIIVVVVLYLIDKEHCKSLSVALTIVHLCGILLSIVTDFLIGGIPSLISLFRWGFIGILFFLAHYAKIKIYDLKSNIHAAMFMAMILLTLSFAFLSFVM